MATLLYIVKLALSGLSPAALVERARAIIAALTGNADFTTPVPTLAAVGAAADAVEAADTAVLNNGGKQDYLARNLRVQELRDLLVLLGAYVQVTSGGDPEKILSAGYPYRKAPEPVGPLPAPGNLRVEVNKLAGQLDLAWDRVVGRMFYEAQSNSTDPAVEADWKSLVNQSDNTYSATGLTGNKLYYFRVRAVGAAGAGPWSDPAAERPR
ncbi:MAG: fibronectin type III domain-containing protein [Flavobacteriales bacterium]|nr:fibronectin type III domain-containing protein [Flavobacteriales bacterium]